MIRELSPSEFIGAVVGEKESSVFFVFENRKVCKLKDNHDFSVSIGLELAVKKEVVVEEGEVVVAPTGVKWAAPYEMGCYLSILPRSGFSKSTPIRIPNAPGTIEPTYRNEIGVLLECVPFKGVSAFEWKGVKCSKGIGGWKVVIPQYSRVAQAVLSINFMAQMRKKASVSPPVIPAHVFFCVDKEIFDNFHKIYPTERGLNGYGSTGV
jgi:dUTPase